MRNNLVFSLEGEALLESLRVGGLCGFASNRRDFGTHVSTSIVWLFLGGGIVLRVRSEMHDLEGWDEVGSLEIDRIELSETVPPSVKLGSQWQNVTSVEKLVVSEQGYFKAESGLKITNSQREVIIICNSAAPYVLALSTPFTHDVFTPEYDLQKYTVCQICTE